MHDVRDLLAHIGLIDLGCLLLVAAAVIGGLRRRSLLAAVGSALGTVLVLWLAAGAALVWGPPGLQASVQASAVFSLLPPPAGAFAELGRLVRGLGSSIT